jgi:hypothetical protein
MGQWATDELLCGEQMPYQLCELQKVGSGYQLDCACRYVNSVNKPRATKTRAILLTANSVLTRPGDCMNLVPPCRCLILPAISGVKMSR